MHTSTGHVEEDCCLKSKDKEHHKSLFINSGVHLMIATKRINWTEIEEIHLKISN